MEPSLESGNGQDCVRCCATNSSNEFMFDNYTHRLIVGSVVALIAIAGTTGNALVIVAVIVSRKLRTTTNAFVVNLSVSDLLSSVLLPFNVYTGVFKGEDQPLPDWLCTAVSYTLLLGLGTCIFSLSLIALNRYVLLTRTLATYQKVYQRRFIALMVCFSWVYPSMLLVVTFAISDSAVYGYSRKYRICLRDSTRGENSSIVNSIGGAFLVLPTILVTLVAYAFIYRHLRRHNRKRLKTVKMRFHPMSNNGDLAMHLGDPKDAGTEGVPPSPDAKTTPQDTSRQGCDVSNTEEASSSPRAPTPPEQRILNVQTNITISLFIIVCVHIVLMLPFAISILTKCSDFALPWIFVLFVATPAVNPLVYGWKHPHFRMVFKSMLTCRYKDIPEPSQIGRCGCLNRSSL
nr:probable G-protein coupled receptor 88 [Lytechinus pictus]